mgnify:CR=1 FL=1
MKTFDKMASNQVYVSRRLKAHDELYSAFMRYKEQEENGASLNSKIIKLESFTLFSCWLNNDV